ncbi:MAG TPA: DUF1206 domain-containing protein [Stellaceae bacterium]|nr:DUF1206 domain-containing protein [Stellaceae bacterium]
MPVAKSLPLASPGSRRAAGWMGRAGYAARGAIYALVGVSAARTTLDPRQAPGGFGGALRPLAQGWAGDALIVLLALGLACFAGWLAIAALDRRDHPGRRHWLLVAGMLGDAAVYIAFMGSLLGMALGWTGGGEHELQSWVGRLATGAAGRVAVGLAGIVVAACGAGLVGWGAVGDVEGPLELPKGERRLVRPVGRYGAIGRGVAIVLVGGCLVLAMVHGNPREAHELGGMLKEVRGLPGGAAVTGALALAFIGSSLSDLVVAGFRRFDPSDPAAARPRRAGPRRRASRRPAARGG